ncbi:hypothetical protein GCM10011510_01070 [Streptococcus himalayensis]|uniref:Uncharacterized protein n=1 Tax=Streptococcus himalayensis TaxID=1888195 RepID=A0A917ECM2_9STRE|nr:hypothetical protein GCM10011510_01070 [Streptococcus himalayensis]
MDPEAEVTVSEVSDSPEEQLKEQEVPTEMTVLPPYVKIVDNTAKN